MSDLNLNEFIDRTVAEIYMKKQKNGYQSFLLTGCEAQVGTTTIAKNVAVAMARAGWKTVLIDSDMRKKQEIAKYDAMKGSSRVGLSDYLTQESSLEEVLITTKTPNLKYISSGTEGKNVVSLVCSSRYKELLSGLRSQFDYIILDSPSMASAIDASVLATGVDGTILITASKITSKHSIELAVSQLEKVDANIIGIIVNRVEKNMYTKAIEAYEFGKNKK